MRVYWFLFIAVFAQSQILDDSTKIIYGPHSTKYFLEKDIENNLPNLKQIDTVFEGFHTKYRINEQAELQDLGMNGTASKFLYGIDNDGVGLGLGMSAFSFNAFKWEDLKYYNTRSPFTDLHYWSGGKGQDLARFVHSQNLSPNLNLAVDLQNFASSKIIGSPSGRDDRLVKNWNVLPYGSFQTKKYKLLGGFQYFSNRQIQQGGISPYQNTAIENSFLYNQELTQLADAESFEKRHQIHVYQQYAFKPGFQFYHLLDYKKQLTRFLDQSADAKGIYSYLPLKITNFDSLKNAVKFSNIENTFGLKGRLKGYNYRLYAKNRISNAYLSYRDVYSDTNVRYNTDSIRSNKTELYLGLWSAFYFKDSVTKIDVNFENNFFEIFENLKLVSQLTSKVGNARLNVLRYDPRLIYTYINSYVGHTEALKNVAVVSLETEANVKGKNWLFMPFFNFRSITNQTYVDTSFIAKSAEQTIVVNQFGTNFNFQKGVHQYGLKTTVAIGGGEVLRFPLLNAAIQYSRALAYKEKLQVNAGARARFLSGYYADAYNPQFNVFYLQNKQKVQGFPILDVFADVKIKKIKIFVSASNLAGLGFLKTGYFTTPNYVALPLHFGYGVNWPLFD